MPVALTVMSTASSKSLEYSILLAVCTDAKILTHRVHNYFTVRVDLHVTHNACDNSIVTNIVRLALQLTLRDASVYKHM